MRESTLNTLVARRLERRTNSNQPAIITTVETTAIDSDTLLFGFGPGSVTRLYANNSTIPVSRHNAKEKRPATMLFEVTVAIFTLIERSVC
jgi:hypothetical protein